MSTVQVIAILGEMRDPYTAGHKRRVAEIAVAIGAELGFDARRQEGLRVAGLRAQIGWRSGAKCAPPTPPATSGGWRRSRSPSAPSSALTRAGRRGCASRAFAL